MAIYHLHVKIIQRSKGKSAIASAAYRRAVKLHDEREQKDWDYTNKPDVIHSELLVPENAPAWAKELVTLHSVEPSQAAEKLWNLVEASEKRKDSQLAREIEFALPIELNQEQNILLAREFIHDQFVLRGMIADWNVHWDKGNPHVHVMLTMRELNESGFGKRALEWNNKTLLQEWREKWAEYANFHLRMHLYDVKIDHRSYQEQGIDLVPTVHQGKAVTDMDRRGMFTNIMSEANEIRQENLNRISANPEVLFNKLSAQSPTFTREQLGQELGRYINDRGKFSIHEKGILSESLLTDINNLENIFPTNEILTPEGIAKILKSIEHHESVFTEKAIAKAIEPFTQHTDQFAKAIVQIKNSSELMYVGVGEDGRDRFTTRTMFHLENSIQKRADQLRSIRHRKIPLPCITEVLKKHQNSIGKYLTDEQMKAVKYLLKPTSISCLVAPAGAGKSFLLGAAKPVWEAQGMRVLGIALSGVASDGLAKDAGIESRTIDSFRYAIAQGTLTLKSTDVIVMDEAGMTDSISMEEVLKVVQRAKAKVVLVGDHAQLQPVGPGASFRALLERLGFVEIQTIYRQKEQWQRDATMAFAAGRIADGLASYEEKGCIHFEKTERDAMSLLINDWLNARSLLSKDLSQYLVVAHRNEDVGLLNDLLRAERVQRQEIADGYFTKAKSGEIKIAQGDRILFLKNDRRLGVSNGRFATIKSVEFTESGKVLSFNVILDGTNKEVRINPSNYRDFTYGYAATVHKVQGMTVDHSFVYAGGSSWNRNLTYVALSRHRETCYLYADKITHRDAQTLKRHLGRLAIKDSLLDFPLAFADRRGIDTSGLLKLLPKHLAGRLKTWKEKITDQLEQVFEPERYAQRKEEMVREKLEIEKITQRREDARLVAAYVDANRDVGMSWQTLQRKLDSLGLDGMSYETQSFSLISGTNEYFIFQKALYVRNEIAFQIMRDSTRYEKALNIYDIDLNKLKNQAEHHDCYKRVQNYVQANLKGAVIHRDRFAAEIAQNIKGHYSYLKSSQINSRDIKNHSVSHLKRQLYRTLTPEEKSSFKLIEDYQLISQKVGSLWSTQNKKEPMKHFVLERLEAIGKERDRLAYEILKDRELYDKALDFYQIGIATPRFGIKPLEQQIRQAEARWYKLQQCAARYELRARVETYHKALFVDDVKQRMQLAHQIIQDTRAHHTSIVGLGRNTQEVWRTIRRDAKLYERHDYYSNLDLIDRIGFKTVESYVEAKRAHANAWREIFESKKTSNLEDKTFFSILSSHAVSYTKERNLLAAKILENVSLYSAGLNYFKINPEELQHQGYSHQCRLNVEDYLNQTNLLLRGKSALALIADPKAHHGLVIESGLNWRNIYQEARIAERKQLFEGLSVEEKSLYRLADQYREINKTSGRLFSRIKLKNSNKVLSSQDSQRIDHAFAKRDYLAWRLVNLAHLIDPNLLKEFAESYGLNADKLLQQHANHTEKTAIVESCQTAYQNVIEDMKDIQAIFDNPKEIVIDKLKKASLSIEIGTQLQKIYRLDKTASLDYALQVYGLSRNDLTQQVKGLSELKNHLQTLINLKQISEKIIIENKSMLTNSVLLNVNAPYEKIDIKRLREDLNARAEEVTQHYLGDPKVRSGSTWRYGSHKGSFVVTVRGQKQGLWRDFQTNEGGDMLSLIKHAMGSSQFKEVLQEANRFLGGYSNYIQPTITKTAIIQSISSEIDAYTLQKIQKAQIIYHATKPIDGTLAERYLREHRGIQGELYGKTFRFHPNLKNWITGETYPALVVIARDKKDNVCGVQAIFLDAKTAKKAPLGHNAKLSRGLIGAGAIVRDSLNGKIALAEGPETALSIAEAHPDWKVYVTFGVSNFDKVPLKTTDKDILICADNDGRDSGTAKSVERAASILSQKGINVWLAEPEKPDHQKKWDFNDALIKQGILQVKKDLDAATLYKAGITQENVTKDLNKSISLIDKFSPESEISDKNQKLTIDTEIKELSFDAILTRYVDLELEQTRLVSAMHSASMRDPKARRDLSSQALVHSNAIKVFAANAIQHPEVKARIEKLSAIKPDTLAKRGGFIAIQDRIKKNKLSSEDIQVLVLQLRNKALVQSRFQARDKDRGGRTT